MTSSSGRPRVAILVVEDEPLLLLDAMDMIEEAGFRCYGAPNAEEALRRLERHDDIGVLFTDVDMPGAMDGLTLARAVRDRWLPVEIIVTSGHVRVGVDELPRGGLFLGKPCPREAVLTALNGLADRAAG